MYPTEHSNDNLTIGCVGISIMLMIVNIILPVKMNWWTVVAPILGLLAFKLLYIILVVLAAFVMTIKADKE